MVAVPGATGRGVSVPGVPLDRLVDVPSGGVGVGDGVREADTVVARLVGVGRVPVAVGTIKRRCELNGR